MVYFAVILSMQRALFIIIPSLFIMPCVHFHFPIKSEWLCVSVSQKSKFRNDNTRGIVYPKRVNKRHVFNRRPILKDTAKVFSRGQTASLQWCSTRQRIGSFEQIRSVEPRLNEPSFCSICAGFNGLEMHYKTSCLFLTIDRHYIMLYIH